ncbi:hypothetical protein [Paenibacillus ihumii]|uniref:hypothetical protein n=1 Tax=Paenibacillus ihumii TaxID=687436 RepID=UPI0011DCEB0D|nr:hypothetical protein [Paenibacillus ihumii]
MSIELRTGMNQSIYNYIDWLSSGVLSGVYEPLVGTFNPDDPFSKEDWLDSAGLAGILFGLRVKELYKSNSRGSVGSLKSKTTPEVNKKRANSN